MKMTKLTRNLVSAILTTASFGAAALACGDYPCTDKADMFNDVLNFSRASRCPTLSNDQALSVAREASHGDIEYAGFKDAYGASCNFDVSLAASRIPGQAAVFNDLVASSAASRCPTLSADQALSIAGRVMSGEIQANDFKTAYSTTCDVQSALDASHNDKDTETYLDIIKMSQASRCPTLSNDEAIGVMHAADAKMVSRTGFKEAYEQTCDYNVSMQAGRSRKRAEAMVDVLKQSAASRCPTLDSNSALAIAIAVSDGRNNEADFMSVYSNSCDFFVALSASRCTPQQ